MKIKRVGGERYHYYFFVSLFFSFCICLFNNIVIWGQGTEWCAGVLQPDSDVKNNCSLCKVPEGCDVSAKVYCRSTPFQRWCVYRQTAYGMAHPLSSTHRNEKGKKKRKKKKKLRVKEKERERDREKRKKRRRILTINEKKRRRRKGPYPDVGLWYSMHSWGGNHSGAKLLLPGRWTELQNWYCARWWTIRKDGSWIMWDIVPWFLSICLSVCLSICRSVCLSGLWSCTTPFQPSCVILCWYKWRIDT